MLPRLLFGAVQTANDSVVSRDVPEYLDSRRFDTLNFLHMGTPSDISDGPGKSFIDVSRIPFNVLDSARGPNGDQVTAHRVVGVWCTHQWTTGGSLPVQMNHYLGSWEAFSHRSNDRRNGADHNFPRWAKQAALKDGGLFDFARPWIAGFARMVGDDVAKELLKDAGLPRNHAVPRA
jgi:hypothetical protein